MTRPDSYVLKLNVVKSNLKLQIFNLNKSIDLLKAAMDDPYYPEFASELEKHNMENLLAWDTEALENLRTIVWE